MTSAVETGARKVFATLVLIREEKNIATFLEHYLHSDEETLDARLPFSKAELGQTLATAIADEFEEQQWDFLAPVFNHRLLHRNIPTEYRLPFIKSRKLGGGGFGNVFEIVIPAGHHNFKILDGAQHARIVRKELRQDTESDNLWLEAGSNEHRIMSYLYHLEHPNILPLLTSYTYNGVPNFLIPLAEDGDLDHFLLAKTRPKDFTDNLTFYDALSGLASALETLHDYKSDVLGAEMIGYHHDLKPKNILVNKSRFVLSDFGLSKLKGGEDSKTPFKRGQGYYLAPECENFDQDFSKGIVSRASDVWSLGCIMLEVVIFMVEGADALVQFRAKRAIKKGFLTTRTFFSGTSINPEVEKKLDDLTLNEDGAVKQVTNLIRQFLVIDIKTRLKASEIALKLRLISFNVRLERLRLGFDRVQWRIDDPNITAEWNKISQATQNRFFSTNAASSGSIEANDLQSSADRSFHETILVSLDKLLDTIATWDLITDLTPLILSNLRELNDLLDRRRRKTQRRTDDDIEEIQQEIDSHHTAANRNGLDRIHKLRWDDHVFAAETWKIRALTVSPDERFLAVESNWHITIYALPVVERVQEIELPEELQLFRTAWSRVRPSLRFLPDGKTLIVCWIRLVCSYEIGPGKEGCSTIFTLLTKGWNALTTAGEGTFEERSNIIGQPIPIQIAAISPDSSRMALAVFTVKNSKADLWSQVIYIVELPGNVLSSIQPIQAEVGEFDCVFGFSPDGRRLAASEQKTVRHDKRNTVRVRVLDAIRTPTDLMSLKWITLYCEEKFDKRPWGGYRGWMEGGHMGMIKNWFSPLTYPRLFNGVWEGRWVAGIWRKSTKTLLLHDLHLERPLASLDLSCLDAVGPGVRRVAFSETVGIAAGCTGPVNTLLPRLLSSGKTTSQNSLAVADARTNRIVCTLEGIYLDGYWLSNQGKYVVVWTQEEHRVFQISEN
ncbi:MAG: hypothetical protein Q9160_006690 [Pyrenula sp. 1 TL-2023]